MKKALLSAIFAVFLLWFGGISMACRLTLDPNWGTITTNDETIRVDKTCGVNTSLGSAGAHSIEAPEWKIFVGWLIGGTVYQVNEEFQIYSDTTAYAQWATPISTIALNGTLPTQVTARTLNDFPDVTLTSATDWFSIDDVYWLYSTNSSQIHNWNANKSTVLYNWLIYWINVAYSLADWYVLNNPFGVTLNWANFPYDSENIIWENLKFPVDLTVTEPQEISNITISWITDPVLWQYSTTQGVTITTDVGEIQLVPDYLSWRKVSNNLDSGSASKFTDEYEAYRLQIVYNPIEWNEMADDYTVNVQNSNYATITTWHTSLWYYIRIEYPVSQMPQEIEHILLIWDLGRFVHWTTPPTNITTNTTWINLWTATWWKGSNCTPLEANETFVSSSNYEDYYCLTIPFTVDEWYVLRNNYYIYRKNIGADRSTNRVYASDHEYACTASEIIIKYLYAEHTIDFMVDWQPRNDTRYRRNWCTLWECGSYGAYPQQPTKEWYVFEWWYTEETFDNKWNWYSSGITENITLYANWLNKINTITISGITVPTSWAQATLEWIEKSADPTAWINRWTLVWKVPTNDNSEDPQPIDFNGTFQWWKSYRLYVPFTIAEWYWIQKWYSNTTIFTVNWTQKDINYDISCSNSLCSAWLSYYVRYIITFYDGETVYTTWTAYGGDTIDYTRSITNPYVPWKKFQWWFKDPELTQQRRLDTDTVTWDMNLYGKFANQLMNINLTWVVTPAGNAAASVAWISLVEWSSGVQLWTIKWQQWESDFNWNYVSWTQYTLYVPFKLIDDYVMPDYYSYISFSVNGEYFYKEIWSTGNEDYPYYVRTYFTATAPSSSSTTPSWGSNWWWGGGGWGGWTSYSCKNLPANATANNKTTPKSNTDYTYDTDTTKVCTFQCNSGYTWNTTSSKCEKAIEATTWDTVVADNPSGDNNWDTNNPQEILANGYTREFNDAYEFAYKNGITTMDTIDKADMNWPLTRIAMAKMLSQYAINVLGKKPANIAVPNFPDITPELDEQYNYGVTLAYQLWIMGINIDKFRPNDLVTRAEFATALSRMLFSTPDWDPYYVTHLAKLKEEKIITNDNPSMQELRGYVMLMLMRSAIN